MPHIGDPEMAFGSHLPSQNMKEVGRPGAASPLIVFLPPDTARQKMNMEAMVPPTFP